MQSQTPRPTIAVCAAMLATFSVAIVNWIYPVLRLSRPGANLAALWVLLALPWVVASIAVVRLRGLRRWLLLVPALCGIVLDAVPIFLGVIGFISVNPMHPDPDATPIAHVALPHGGALVVYDITCGALCGLDYEIRQERAILPGVLLVRSLGAGTAGPPSIAVLSPSCVLIGADTVRVSRWVHP